MVKGQQRSLVVGGEQGEGLTVGVEVELGALSL